MFLATAITAATLLFLPGVGGGAGGGPEKPKETTVVGYVADVRVTGKNERLFWDVEEGLDAVTLTKGKEDERLSYVCVWDGAPPAKFVKAGNKITVVGVVSGRTTAGATILKGCRLKE